MAEAAETKPFKKINEIEYEIQLQGRTKTIKTPFAVTEKIFHAFVTNGGMIDPATGQVQQDILQLISSFKELGDILLSEYDEEGRLTKGGNCGNLGTTDVVNLFQLASEIVSDFILVLTQMQAPKSQPENEQEEKVTKTKKG